METRSSISELNKIAPADLISEHSTTASREKRDSTHELITSAEYLLHSSTAFSSFSDLRSTFHSSTEQTSPELLPVYPKEEIWIDHDCWDPLDSRGKPDDEEPVLLTAKSRQASVSRELGFKLDQYLEILIARLSLEELEELEDHVVRKVAAAVVKKLPDEAVPSTFAAQILYFDLKQCWLVFCQNLASLEGRIETTVELLGADISALVDSYKLVYSARKIGDKEQERRALKILDDHKMQNWKSGFQSANKIDELWAQNVRYFCKWVEPQNADYDGEWRKQLRNDAQESGLWERWIGQVKWMELRGEQEQTSLS